jgi:hypothetical protein
MMTKLLTLPLSIFFAERLARPRIFFTTCLLLAALSACDSVEREYEDVFEARRDRFFERGWLPDILPASASQIKVKYDLDTNASQGEFRFEAGDFADFARGLVRDPEAENVWAYTKNRRRWEFTCSQKTQHCRYQLLKAEELRNAPGEPMPDRALR